MLYRHFPSPSTTSLSDADDDEPAQSNFFKTDQSPYNIDAAVQPHWSATSTQPGSNRAALKAVMKSPISNLPPELLIAILKYIHSPRELLNALKVSRTWCECAVELLWHKPAFSKSSTLDKMARMLKRPKQLFPYARFIRRLNFLALGVHLLDDTLVVFSRCSRLERLTLTGCKAVTPHSLEKLLTCSPNLVALDLTDVVDTTTEVVSAFAAVAKRLQGINLSGCNKVTDTALIALGDNCPLLRRVKLSGVKQITDDGVSAIVRNCPLLLEIDLHQCDLITDVAVRTIWLHSPQMREMRLSLCTKLTDLAFPATTVGMNPFAINNDPNNLPPLQVDRSYEQLRLLDLTGCSAITDEAIEGLVSHCPKIRNLVLAKCLLLTDRSVEAICSLGKHLHYLHLGHASRITDGSVKTLARSCTRIRYIDFANCTNLTDMSVFELSALPKLRRIGLVRVTNLTDEAVYSLAERHATLERIHLSYCDQISVMAVHFLLLKLHKLTHLSLSGVPAFRTPELQRFCKDAPKDFNTAQRQNFCVFSGKGVSQLRQFLTELFDNFTEQNGTDDTEYEDEDYFHEPFQMEQTPEPETGDDDAPAYHVISPHINGSRGSRATRHDAPNPSRFYELILQREQARRALRGLRLPTQPGAGGWEGQEASGSAYHHGPGTTMADVLPIIEPVTPVSAPMPTTTTNGTDTSALGAFFQGSSGHHPGPSEPMYYIDERDSSPSRSPRHRSSVEERTPQQPHAVPNGMQRHASRSRPSSSRAMSDPGSHSAEMEVTNEGWRNGIDLNGPAMRELQESVHSALDPSLSRNPRAPGSGRERHRREHRENGSGSRGRSVRRTIRNGLNAAENYATNFLFGRPWNEESSGSGHASDSNNANGGANSGGSNTRHRDSQSGSSNAHWFSGR
ncbi:SCF E3 ubiquitin ligase complex F-box protein grrA [Coprinopsis sp. MPI-PUGE-AT-0042]|nr:SCF E3 ubiquitin ligase complex F-box protein grrA [Coprinopsis sp. MPI-PUGE-AT-0042]